MRPSWIPDRCMFNALRARIPSPLNGERARVRGESDGKRPHRRQCLNTSARRPVPALVLLGLVLVQSVSQGRAGEPSPDRPSIVLENESARLIMDLNGGSLGEFRFLNRDLNPLHWA